MAPIGKLYGHPAQYQTQVILSAAAIAGHEIEMEPFEFGVTNKSPEFLQKFSLGKVPAFEDNEGFKLFEGDAIARHVSALNPKSGLLGRNAVETSLVNQFVHFAEYEIQVSGNIIYGGIVYKAIPGYNAELHGFHADRIERPLKYLNDYLATRPSGLLINDEITLADLQVAVATLRAGQTVCGAKEREQVYPHAFAHYAKVASDARLKEIFGEPSFVETALSIQTA